MTPLSGVRISWLIVARNSDLARDACKASSRASAISSAAQERSATWASMTSICWKMARSAGSGAVRASVSAAITHTSRSPTKTGPATCTSPSGPAAWTMSRCWAARWVSAWALSIAATDPV